MSKRRLSRIPIIIITIIICAYEGFSFVRMVTNKDNIESRCFENIEELEFLNEYATKDISKDKNLTTTPLESWCKEIKYNGRKYKVYAYVFESTEDTKAYFEKATKHTLFIDSWVYYSSKDYIFYSYAKCLIYNENCVLYISGHTKFYNFCKDINEITNSFQEFETKFPV